MKKLRKIILLLFIFGITMTLASTAIFVFMNSAPMSDRSAQTTEFMVQQGSTVRMNAAELKRSGLIRNTDFFVALSYLFKKQKLLTGNYTIEKTNTNLEILDKLSSGSVITVWVTIPEGFNLFSIAPRLEQEGICEKERFLYYAFDQDFLESLGINAPSAEGYLFPDTYSFAPGSDPRDVIKHLHNRMILELESLDYEKKMLPSFNLNKLLFLSSIIEAEAQIKSEQRRISSVFHNRIKRNMRFDSDPTVRYAVKKFSGRIRYRDLESPSPYNTYRRTGFPPGPIASPGRGALYAALNPEDSDYLYFVARNDGSHYFSKTLSQHNRAVEYYQKNMSNGFIDDQL
ncbi:MAG: endolytic transglycosylase MltG [Spirochaetes bacterium]|jgi:UPF0755 protein|nr:endolytic transglycosylase MltG [Spirochaetota bacterium]